eukprot:CAMPEP_0119332770 /NCGR_PEP_ID=MMETSP1333-20130426/83595_1 /TAXON_ID=418940 /ORGANISM="Scyphosphaera apsteinii, Strain RCC1455" /LENGTH=88 /DNA_ID=CAMNT_0007342675 /DNA_START=61 /DNA_END=327 /DNA_ORIENTATION=-
MTPLCPSSELSSSKREPVKVMVCLVVALVRHVGDPTRSLPWITMLRATSSIEASAKMSSAPAGTVSVPDSLVPLESRYFVLVDNVTSV